MPFFPGSSPTDDGAVAATQSSAKAGLFGHNDGTDAPPPGSPGGAGVFGLTVVPTAAGVFGANNHPSSGVGVQGNGPEAGLSGFSETGVGVRSHSNHGDAVQSFAHSSDHNAVLAMNDSTGTAPTSGAPAGNGILAVTTVDGGIGVLGTCNHSTHGRGVQGNGPEAGVSGFSEGGTGVLAHSNHGDAMQSFAHSSDHNGILGHNNSTTAAPTTGGPPIGNGVFGFTQVPNGSGVCGAVDATNTDGAGITGIGPTAGRFIGNIVVTGDVQLTGGDLAEQFQVVDPVNVTPGTVVCLEGLDRVQVSTTAYDRRVAGVVSGAGDYRPGLVLDQQSPSVGRKPLALVGKVFCKVDASYAPIEIGDLLTTSATPGHAMKATQSDRAFGAILGKSMGVLAGGTGMLPILVTLQ